MRELEIMPIRAEKLTFKNKDTGEITYLNKITYLVPIEENDYVSGSDIWETYSKKSLKEITPLLNRRNKAFIQEIKESNRLKLKVVKIGNLEL